MTYRQELIKNKALHADILECLRQENADIVHDEEDVILIRVRENHVYFMAGSDTNKMIGLTDSLEPGPDGFVEVVVRDPKVYRHLTEDLGYEGSGPCYQVLYEKTEAPDWKSHLEAVPGNGTFALHIPREEDFEAFRTTYGIGDDQMKERFFHHPDFRGLYMTDPEGKKWFAGYVGMHEEGAMGLLYIAPDFRRLGLGRVLQEYIISEQMARGAYPYGQIYESNEASAELSRGMGMSFADGRIYWAWKGPKEESE